jgi:hypothetical protein
MTHPNLLETAFNPWSPALYNFMFNVGLVRRIMIMKGELILYGRAGPFGPVD